MLPPCPVWVRGKRNRSMIENGASDVFQAVEECVYPAIRALHLHREPGVESGSSVHGRGDVHAADCTGAADGRESGGGACTGVPGRSARNVGDGLHGVPAFVGRGRSCGVGGIGGGIGGQGPRLLV